MALSTATISYDFSDQVGTDFDTRRTKVWVSTNIDDGTVIDTVGNAIRVDTGLGTLAADGTGSVVVWIPGTGSNPDSWQTYVHLDYASPMDRTRKRRTFGPFTVTTSANLADLVEEQEVPAEYLTTITAALQDLVDDADAEADRAEAEADSAAAASVSAAASATSAAASAAAAEVISDIATPDALVAALVGDSGSDTARALAVPLNVRAFGAVGDSSTNSTTAIQNAINAADAAGIGRVIIPADTGDYIFSNLEIPGGVQLIGDGYSLPAQVAFGNSAYNAGGAYAPTGSVLRSTATSGTAILLATDSNPHRISGLCVVGPGTGTSTGIAFEDTTDTTKHRLDDVMVANFYRCWLMAGCEDATFIHLKARGCNTGFELSSACNQNAWVSTEVQFSSNIAIQTTDSAANTFNGILLQNCTGAAALKHVSGESNVYGSIYHESSGSLTKLIHIVAGSYNAVRDLWCSAPLVASAIDGGGFNEFENWNGSGSFTVDVGAGGGNHNLTNIKGLTVTGSGGIAACRVFDSTQLRMGASADVRVASGKKFYFETTGTGSYIGRNTGTAETEIGTPVSLSLVGHPALPTTAPAAGGAGALPATPVGYLPVRINGTVRQIPVY